MTRWESPIGGAFVRLRDAGCLSHPDAELLLTHLLAGRSPAFWSENAAAQIRNNAEQRDACSEFRNRAYVSEQIAAMSPPEFPERKRAAERWLSEPLARFERALRSSYANRHTVLSEHRAAYLKSVFVLSVVSANASSVPPQRASTSFPPTSGRSKW